MDEIRLTIPEPSERPAERAELLKVESAALAADKEKLRRLAPLLRPSRSEWRLSMEYVRARFKIKLMGTARTHSS